jgi:hypothetical protein
MAKQKTTQAIYKATTKSVSRPGIHAKSKTSTLKSSKNYTKKYRGQGR